MCIVLLFKITVGICACFVLLFVALRIDNCGWALFHKSAYISETKQGILVNHTSNEWSYFSLSYDQ